MASGPLSPVASSVRGTDGTRPHHHLILILANPPRTYEAVAELTDTGLWRITVRHDSHWRPLADILLPTTELDQ